MATVAQEWAIPPVLVNPPCGRTVLVVEDDRFVREAACKVLTESGFNVLAAESAAAAQARFFVDSERVDVVLCDAMLLDGRFASVGKFEEVFNTSDEQIKDFYNYNFIQ